MEVISILALFISQKSHLLKNKITVSGVNILLFLMVFVGLFAPVSIENYLIFGIQIDFSRILNESLRLAVILPILVQISFSFFPSEKRKIKNILIQFITILYLFLDLPNLYYSFAGIFLIYILHSLKNKNNVICNVLGIFLLFLCYLMQKGILVNQGTLELYIYYTSMLFMLFNIRLAFKKQEREFSDYYFILILYVFNVFICKKYFLEIEHLYVSLALLPLMLFKTLQLRLQNLIVSGALIVGMHGYFLNDYLFILVNIMFIFPFIHHERMQFNFETISKGQLILNFMIITSVIILPIILNLGMVGDSIILIFVLMLFFFMFIGSIIPKLLFNIDFNLNPGLVIPLILVAFCFTVKVVGNI